MNRLERLIDERDALLSVRMRTLKKALHRDLTLTLIKRLLPYGGCGVDVGANRGVYTWAMARQCGPEGGVLAVEPIPANVARLERLAAKRPWISVCAAGASDAPGTAELSIPVQAGRQLDALGTLGGVTVDHDVIDVDLVTLDGLLASSSQLKGRRVSLVKCDVEGHERSVLAGAHGLLVRDRPAVFVEVEQRHLGERQVDEVFDLLLGVGHHGYLVRGGRLERLASFDVHRDQLRYVNEVGFAAGDMPAQYVHDFLFLPGDPEKVADLLDD